MKKQIGVLLLLSVLLYGCLGDEVDRPTVVPQLVFSPAFTYFKAVTNSTDVQVRWNRSTSDIHENFKGYFVKLFSSKADVNPLLEDTLVTELDSVHVGPGDTTYTFHNLALLNRYTVEVYGERFSNDTPVYSEGHSFVSFTYDSRAVLAPQSIFASSAGPTSVNLQWSASPSDKQLGFSGYIIRYRDTTSTSSHVIYLTTVPADTLHPFTSLLVSVPGNTQSTIVEKPYKFWIKAVRKDSVESDDSIGISWSGAERYGVQANIDTAVGIGTLNGTYAMALIDPSNAAAWFTVKFDGTNVTLSGLNSIKFVDHADIDSTGDLNQRYFSQPFAASEFTQNSISFAQTSKRGGAQIYALVPDVGRARFLITSADSSGYIMTASNGIKSINIQASFQPQPKGNPGLPYF